MHYKPRDPAKKKLPKPIRTLPPYVYESRSGNYRVIKQYKHIRVNGPVCSTPEEALKHLPNVIQRLNIKIHGEFNETQSVLTGTPWQGLLGVNSITARYDIPEPNRDPKANFPTRDIVRL